MLCVADPDELTTAKLRILVVDRAGRSV